MTYLLLATCCLFLLADRALGQQSADQLDCAFDQGSFCNWVNGLNGNEDDFDWNVGSNLHVDGFHSIPRTVSGTGQFAYVQGGGGSTNSIGDRAWLRSPVINGLAQPATLSFNYWKNAAPPVLQVCTRDAGVAQLTCVDTISGLGQQRWIRRIVTIPANPIAFQIILVSSGLNSAIDTIGVDDITFQRNPSSSDFSRFLDGRRFRPQFLRFRDNVPTRRLNQASTRPSPTNARNVNTNLPSIGSFDSSNGQYGNSGNIGRPTSGQIFGGGGAGQGNGNYGTTRPYRPVRTTTTQRPYQTPRPSSGPVIQPSPGTGTRPASRGSCSAVSCMFDNDLCQWYNDFKANFDWRLYATGSQYGGIPGDTTRPSYIFVSGDRRKSSQRASLRSGTLSIFDGANLEFYVYNTERSSGRLSLYRNSISGRNLLYQITGNKELGNGWQKVTVKLPPSGEGSTLIFVADSLIGGQYIGVDNVRMIDGSGAEISCGSNNGGTGGNGNGNGNRVTSSPQVQYRRPEDQDFSFRNVASQAKNQAINIDNPKNNQNFNPRKPKLTVNQIPDLVDAGLGRDRTFQGVVVPLTREQQLYGAKQNTPGPIPPSVIPPPRFPPPGTEQFRAFPTKVPNQKFEETKKQNQFAGFPVGDPRFPPLPAAAFWPQAGLPLILQPAAANTGAFQAVQFPAWFGNQQPPSSLSGTFTGNAASSPKRDVRRPQAQLPQNQLQTPIANGQAYQQAYLPLNAISAQYFYQLQQALARGGVVQGPDRGTVARPIQQDYPQTVNLDAAQKALKALEQAGKRNA